MLGKSVTAVAFIATASAFGQQAEAQTLIDVWDSSNPAEYQLVGQIQSIKSAETGASHYNYWSASGHPACTNPDRRHANIWVHENTNGGDLTFGFLFAKHVSTSDLENRALLNFRIVDSSGDPYVSQSDDPGEAVETPAGSNAFVGNFYYNPVFTDGIAVSGIGGGEWTVIIEAVDFGNITNWYAAGGGTANEATVNQQAGCPEDLADLSLTLGNEYRLTPAGHPPSGAPVSALEIFASAGPDQTVEIDDLVTLDGSGSLPDDATLTFSWTQISGTLATDLMDTNSAYPSFTAPIVARGGETLTFQLIYALEGVTDCGGISSEIDCDQVNITVANDNHTPVAFAGHDQSIAEGSLVYLSGVGSYDPDGDEITYIWEQVSGDVTVAITGADTSAPSFTAPYVEAGGATGVVATLVFKLTVDDGYAPDLPADGHTFDDVMDTVTVEITNVNNVPIAVAGGDQTVDENTGDVLDDNDVHLNGGDSSDPDGDDLTYVWEQIGDGPSVVLVGETTATPSFTLPFVSPGGEDLTFELTVHDGYGGMHADQVIVHVQNANDPPLVSAAEPTVGCIWPPNHKLVSVGVTGVSDPDDNATITIDSVTQDEVTEGLGDGDTAVDAIINDDGTVLLRAERSGKGDGRIYHIAFTASDLEGSASGSVDVCVQHSKKKAAVDSGVVYDSTQ